MVHSLLFPPEAAFCYVRTSDTAVDLHNYENLHPLERSLVSHSVKRRQAEFGDARWCAHQALADLGCKHSSEPILKGERGMPIFPTGIAGSLTHTDGLRAAVVGKTTDFRALGIDVEPAEPLPEGVMGQIARAGEIEQDQQLRAGGLDFSDRLLFCAKEATYKAWFPMTGRYLDFDEAEIDIREDGTFISYLLVRPTPVPFINGRWAVTDGYVLAATFVDSLERRRAGNEYSF